MAEPRRIRRLPTPPSNTKLPGPTKGAPPKKVAPVAPQQRVDYERLPTPYRMSYTSPDGVHRGFYFIGPDDVWRIRTTSIGIVVEAIENPGTNERVIKSRSYTINPKTLEIKQ